MNPDARLDRLLDQLEIMPAELRDAAAKLGTAGVRVPLPGAGFCLVEQAWHLADLEREAFGARIERLLSDSESVLPDFDGARTAVERDYKSKSLAEGIAAFAAARRANVARLRSVGEQQWKRSGTQEGVGRVTLADIPRLMLEHDESHRAEIAAILASVHRG